MWKYQNTPHNPTITQNTHMKVKTKYPKMLNLCFVSFKVKNIITLYIKNQKPQNTLIQQHNSFFTLGENVIFYF
jgi:uncharacterized membrane protein